MPTMRSSRATLRKPRSSVALIPRRCRLRIGKPVLGLMNPAAARPMAPAARPMRPGRLGRLLPRIPN
jgi:hypothetical protein